MTLMMSVSGVRGIVGETMTPQLGVDLGAAFGTHLAGGRVAIGRDTRISGPLVQNAVTSGLLAAGCEVVDLGVASTPAVSVMVQELSAAGGVVITASHNPIVWNGVKFLEAGGYAPPPEVAERILDIYHRKSFTLVDVERLKPHRADARAADCHLDRVLRTVDASAIRKRRFRVVLDSINGAGSAEGRRLLEELGCTVVHLNGEPTGRFAHTPEPIEDNLTGLCTAVRKENADVGFAQDPDADRCAVVDEAGGYIGEEYTLALAARFAFASLGGKSGTAAVNLSTSRRIDDLARQARDVRIHRTPVGEAHVARAMREHGCIIGGEGNGGVIDPRVTLVRDSLVAMSHVLALLTRENRSLCEIVADMPQYVMVKQKFEIDRERVALWLRRIQGAVANGRINDVDGLRIDWPEGWVHVRPSNTEPIARVIAEAEHERTAHELAARVTDLL